MTRTGRPIVSFRLAPALLAALQARASADRTTAGDICRRALASHLGHAEIIEVREERYYKKTERSLGPVEQ